MIKKLVYYSTLFFSVLLYGCKDNESKNTYDIDSNLAPYLDKFEKEAAKRGVTFDLEKDGLIMKFSDLEEPAIGLCTYSDPILVEIDKKYWAATVSSANCENLRETVVFHELAHGLLKRRHTNTTLDNDEWKSMMCGDPPSSDKDWSVNFNGARKTYYVDELFDMKTSAPEYTKRVPFDGDKGTLVLNRDYAFLPPREMTEDYGVQNVIKDGLLTLTNLNEENTLYPIETIDGQDFFIEMKMSSYSPEENSAIGMWVASKKGEANYYLTFRDDNLCIGNTLCNVQFFCALNIGNLLEGGTSNMSYFPNSKIYNTYALRKVGDELFFYVNGILAYWNDYKLEDYKYLGVVVPANGAIYVKNLILYIDEPSSTRSKESIDMEPKGLHLPKYMKHKCKNNETE